MLVVAVVAAFIFSHEFMQPGFLADFIITRIGNSAIARWCEPMGSFAVLSTDKSLKVKTKYIGGNPARNTFGNWLRASVFYWEPMGAVKWFLESLHNQFRA